MENFSLLQLTSLRKFPHRGKFHGASKSSLHRTILSCMMNSYTLMVILQIKNAFIFIQKSAEDIKRLDFMENSISAAICSVLEFLL